MAPTSIKLIAGSSHPELANKIAQRLGIKSTPIEIVQYSNQEKSITIKDGVRDEDVFILQSSTAKVNDCLMELLQIIHACRAARARRITAILPSYPYARQDKTSKGHNGPTESRTAELVAIMLQAAGCDHVITLDLHNPGIENFFTIPIKNLSAESWISDRIRTEIAFGSMIPGLAKAKEYIIVSPDAGGVPRAKIIACILGLPLVCIHKERAQPNEISSMSLVAGDDDDEKMISGRTAIIVDDMADTCGTLVKAADLLMQHGTVAVMAMVTHAILSGEDTIKKLNDSAITTIFVTNSVPIPADWEVETSSNMMEIFDVSDLLADACLEVHRRGKGEENSPWASSVSDRRMGVAGGTTNIMVEYIWPVLLTLFLSALYVWVLWMGLMWWFGHRLLLLQ